MKFKCPKCQSLYQIDDAKIPARGAYIRCKKCQNRIFLSGKSRPPTDASKTITCPKCSQKQLPGKTCFYCGAIITANSQWIGASSESKAQTTNNAHVPNQPSEPVHSQSADDCKKEHPDDVKSDHHRPPLEDHKEHQFQLPHDKKQALHDFGMWSHNYLTLGAILLIIGFILPLLKRSLLFDDTIFAWPWVLMGNIKNQLTAAATATLSESGNMVMWTLLPLMGGLLTLGLRLFANIKIRIAGMLIIGSLMLILMQLFFYKESEIFGLVFIPPTFGAAFFETLVIIVSALVAAANHLRKSFTNQRLLRLLSGIGGVLLIIAVLLPFLAASGAWKAWTVILIYLAMLAYAIVSIITARQPYPDDSMFSILSLIARITLGWLPLALLVAQRNANNDFVYYVMEAGGGFFHIFMSVVKCFCIYYGSMFLMATGITGALELVFLRQKKKEK